MTSTDERLYASFRPRFVRYVAWGAILLTVAGLVVLLATAPGSAEGRYSPPSVGGMVVVVTAGSVFLWRQATVRADVDATSVTVRNLVVVRTFAWPQVVAVTFGTGDPWVVLELSDGNRHPVMGVQRADGAYAAREAQRLATLVALHGEGVEQGPGAPRDR